MLTTHDLTIGYAPPRKKHIIIAQALQLHLKAGELCCLIGRNGVGKSTLMRTLAGVQKPLAGDVWLTGAPLHQLSVTELAQKVAIVLTTPIEQMMMHGRDLVALGRHPYTDWAGRLSDADQERVDWAIGAVNGAHLAELPLSELSDGGRQRLSIARALAQETDLILLDEPTAFLDVVSRAEIISLLRQIAKSTHRAILLSTHDLDLALRMADVLWVMDDGVVHVGAPEDLALSGILNRAFASDAVQFDPLTMRFQLHRQGTPIHVVGDADMAYALTCHALVRAGFVVADETTHRATTVTISQADGAVRWQVDEKIYHTLYELLQTLL